MPLSLLSLSLLPQPVAHAQAPSGPGYSGPTYGGSGTFYAPGPGGAFGNQPDGPFNGGWGGGSGGSNNATCSGSITTTFTWQPGQGNTDTTNPPPQNVLVTETSTASASGASYPPATVGGACDNGIGVSLGHLTQTPVMNGSTQVGTSGSGKCASTRYRVKTGGATVTLQCSPSASASAADTATSNVSYSAAVYPITIDVSVAGGTAKDIAQSALAGQQIKASLNLNGAPATIQSYTFSVNGQAFATWDPNAPGGSPAMAQYQPLSSYDLSGSGSPAAVYFYDEHNSDQVTVTCTATVQFPDNTTKTVTATSQPVTFIKPTVIDWGVNSSPNRVNRPPQESFKIRLPCTRLRNGTRLRLVSPRRSTWGQDRRGMAASASYSSLTARPTSGTQPAAELQSISGSYSMRTASGDTNLNRVPTDFDGGGTDW